MVVEEVTQVKIKDNFIQKIKVISRPLYRSVDVSIQRLQDYIEKCGG